MVPNEDVVISETVKARVEPSDTPLKADMVTVTVTAESGIFKNGQHYPKGAQAVISRHAAEGFAAIGEVTIVEPAGAPLQ